MSNEDSLTEVIDQVKLGDVAAVQSLWDRYFPQVVRLAGSRLAGRRKAAADEEDVAISVMESFFRAAAAGRFPDLRDRDGIWRLLSSMTCRKAIDLIRRNSVRHTVELPDSALQQVEPNDHEHQSPLMAIMVADEIDRLFKLLDPKYHDVARLKLECRTVSEIASECRLHISTIERRLRIIREIWAQAIDRENGD